ncbi:unnamed protein product [Spirodela intermedia]|uniref:Uncharacterized protein n=1 Tax=Spirodela intermedia TaxID=51605 RepID=A0A7I8JZ08_SPIIN|nr:unnamed protein product [Spirodela intermedia]
MGGGEGSGPVYALNSPRARSRPTAGPVRRRRFSPRRVRQERETQATIRSNWAPSKVWPNCQPEGPLLCQFWPQFRDMACQPEPEPLTETAWTSPAPPTLVMRTRLNCGSPFSPPEGHWHYPRAVLRNLQEGGLGKVEVLQRRVAPATVVVGQREVGRAEQEPQLSPLLKRAVLSAAVFVPYPWL